MGDRLGGDALNDISRFSQTGILTAIVGFGRLSEMEMNQRHSLCCCVVLLVVGARGFAQALNSQHDTGTPTASASPALHEFQLIEDTWSDAVNRHDQYAVELVLSPQFIDVSSDGNFTTRNQQLALVVTGEDKVLRLERRVITVRLFGDIAVASGTYSLLRKNEPAHAGEKGVFTHVFERHASRWICINAQRTVVPMDSIGRSRRQSHDERGFHIPLFFKSGKE
jgi:ketosteroid isomerase-like protein